MTQQDIQQTNSTMLLRELRTKNICSISHRMARIGIRFLGIYYWPARRRVRGGYALSNIIGRSRPEGWARDRVLEYLKVGTGKK